MISHKPFMTTTFPFTLYRQPVLKIQSSVMHFQLIYIETAYLPMQIFQVKFK